MQFLFPALRVHARRRLGTLELKLELVSCLGSVPKFQVCGCLSLLPKNDELVEGWKVFGGVV
jgi:hypothetical protein